MRAWCPDPAPRRASSAGAGRCRRSRRQRDRRRSRRYEVHCSQIQSRVIGYRKPPNHGRGQRRDFPALPPLLSNVTFVLARSSGDGAAGRSRPAQLRPSTTARQSRSSSAVSAQRMLTTSMASCRKAPDTTGIKLNAAATMPIRPARDRPARLAASHVWCGGRWRCPWNGGDVVVQDHHLRGLRGAVDVPSVMAMPISAAANTGASFTPSPTIIVTPRDGVTVAVVTAVTYLRGTIPHARRRCRPHWR